MGVDPFEEKNKSTSPLHIDPQRLGRAQYKEGMVVRNCMDIPRYTLTWYISLPNRGWRIT